ncbi:hypothetical protein GCM10018952_01850 [Streptosporangium vulgare]
MYKLNKKHFKNKLHTNKQIKNKKQQKKKQNITYLTKNTANTHLCYIETYTKTYTKKNTN